MVSWVQARAIEMMNEHGFLGVPVETFEFAGRHQFVSLLEQGLTPESSVLDLGCGCLRTGYWLVRFLDRGGYFGIEPARRRTELGLRYLFSGDIVYDKAPRFQWNSDFDFSGFGQTFDFVLAGSIWTHGSKAHISKSLASFRDNSTSTSVFLTTYLPPIDPGDEYMGETWVGTSHESDTPGIVRHSLSWIAEACAAHGLAVQAVPGDAFDSQFWLRISYAE